MKILKRRFFKNKKISPLKTLSENTQLTIGGWGADGNSFDLCFPIGDDFYGLVLTRQETWNLVYNLSNHLKLSEDQFVSYNKKKRK